MKGGGASPDFPHPSAKTALGWATRRTSAFDKLGIEMENEEQRQRALPILQQMEQAARVDFDDEDIDNLRTLVYLTINFTTTSASTPPGQGFLTIRFATCLM